MAIKLPEFKGYTVDFRLREFRKVDRSRGIEFIKFDTEKGYYLLSEMINSAGVEEPVKLKVLLYLMSET